MAVCPIPLTPSRGRMLPLLFGRIMAGHNFKCCGHFGLLPYWPAFKAFK